MLQKILPASFFETERATMELQANIKKNQDEIKILSGMILDISQKLDVLQKTQDELLTLDAQNNKCLSFEQEVLSQEIKTIECNISKMESLDELYCDRIGQELSSLKDSITKNNNTAIKIQKETLWSSIFNNTIRDSKWLINQAFSPGRWAMGYPALYILYRVLEQFTPCHILELGLGQSTKMITQYAAQNKGIEHFVVEHDSEWIDFYKKNNAVSSNTNIICLDREIISYKDAEEVRVFRNFKRTFESYKFDLIVIDAPLGGDMKKYARIDALSLIGTNLCEQFVLILDDVNRAGEKNTMNEISFQLTQANIQYNQKVYEGEKETCLWTTPQWNFLCSL